MPPLPAPRAEPTVRSRSRPPSAHTLRPTAATAALADRTVSAIPERMALHGSRGVPPGIDGLPALRRVQCPAVLQPQAAYVAPGELLVVRARRRPREPALGVPPVGQDGGHVARPVDLLDRALRGLAALDALDTLVGEAFLALRRGEDRARPLFDLPGQGDEPVASGRKTALLALHLFQPGERFERLVRGVPKLPLEVHRPSRHLPSAVHANGSRAPPRAKTTVTSLRRAASRRDEPYGTARGACPARWV